jgi:hypothetical protein
MTKTFQSFGADVDFMDAAQYRRYIEEEIKRWRTVGQKARISIN